MRERLEGLRLLAGRTLRLVDRLPAPPRPLTGTRVELGVALSPDGAVAVEARRGLRGLRPARTRRRELADGPGADGWPELERALDALRDDLGRAEGGTELHVALLPPLARAKCLRLPALRRERLRHLLAREAGRHFLGAPEEPVTDAAAARRPWAEHDGRRVAVCADRGRVEAVLAAIRGAGFRPGLVVAGAPALAEGATALEPGLREGDVRLTVDDAPWEEELELEDGRLCSIRPSSPAEAAGGPREGDGPTEPEGSRRLGEPGETHGGLGPRSLAAFGALLAAEDGPSLLPGEARARWRRRLRRRALTLAAAALALLGVAAVLHLWGIERELDAVAAERAAVAERVRRTTDARDALLEIRRLLASVRRARTRTPRWTEVLSSLADALPPSAYLESIRTTEEGIRLAGVARSPSSLVPRLQELPVLEEVTAPTTGRTTDGGRSFEVGVTLTSSGPRPAGEGGAP